MSNLHEAAGGWAGVEFIVLPSDEELHGLYANSCALLLPPPSVPLLKPRTECGCQSVVFVISFRLNPTFLSEDLQGAEMRPEPIPQ